MVNIANILTASRIVAALCLLVVSPDSPVFWCLYAWCGISDMIDGPIARRCGRTSAFGSKLDSASDLVFVVACVVTLVPAVMFPFWLLMWVSLIALVKIAAFAKGAKTLGIRVPALHTKANKIAGLIIFLTVPLWYVTGLSVVTVPACLVASVVAFMELRAAFPVLARL